MVERCWQCITMMGRKWIGLRAISFLCFTILITRTSCESVNIYLLPGESGNVTSPGFPSCCSRDLNLTYIFQCPGFSSIRGSYLFHFSDLDLPPDAVVGVFTRDAQGNAQQASFVTYNKRNRSWKSSYISIRGCYVAFAFLIKKSSAHLNIYAGFKLYYEYDTIWNNPLLAFSFHYSSYNCGGSLEAVTGGQVSVEEEAPSGKPYTRVRYCVWQIKPQPGFQSTGVMTFLRVNHLYLKGSLEIRRGISSESPIIFEWRKSSNFLMSIDKQPQEGFSSAEGFYIAMRLNATVGGRFGFIYGDYVKSPLLDANDRLCNFGHQTIVPGFHCAASQWCIPRSLLCDKVQHCSQNEDEQLHACLTTTTITTTTTTTTTTTVAPSTTTRKLFKPTWWWATDAVTPHPFWTTPGTKVTRTHKSTFAAKVKYVGVGIAFFLICLSLYLGYRLKTRKRRAGGGLTSDLCPSISGGVNNRSGASAASRPYRSVTTQPGLDSGRPANPTANAANRQLTHQQRNARLLPNRPNIYNRPTPRGPFVNDSASTPLPPEPSDLQQPPPSYNSIVARKPTPSVPSADFVSPELPPSYDQVMAETENNININLQHSTVV